MKWCSTLLIITEINISGTSRYQFLYIRSAEIKNVWVNMENKLSHIAGRNINMRYI